MTDERYEVLESRLDSVRRRFSRETSATREHLHSLISEVQHLQADIKPLLDDLARRQKGEEMAARLREKREEIEKRDWELRRHEWDANLAILRERQAELDAQIHNSIKIGGVLTRLLALLMLLALPIAFIFAAMGVITPEQQTNAFVGAALFSIGGGALVLWNVFTELDQ